MIKKSNADKLSRAEINQVAEALALPEKRDGFDLRYSAAHARGEQWGFACGADFARRAIAKIRKLEADAERYRAALATARQTAHRAACDLQALAASGEPPVVPSGQDGDR